MKKLVFLALAVSIGAGVYLYWWTPRGAQEPERSIEQPNLSKSETQDFLEKKGAALYKERYFRTQIAAYEAVLKAAPQSQQTKQKLADLHYEIGKLALEGGDIEMAKKEFQETLQLVPEHDEARNLLAKTKTP